MDRRSGRPSLDSLIAGRFKDQLYRQFGRYGPGLRHSFPQGNSLGSRPAARPLWSMEEKMKNSSRLRYGLLPLLLSICIGLAFSSATAKAEPVSKGMLGRWDLTLTTPGGELPSWIEISEEQGQPKILMVGVTDHATPLKKFTFKDSELEFVSPKAEEGFKADMLFKGKLSGHELVGTVTDPAGTVWQWRGVRAPELKRKSPPKWGQPVTLFNGKDLTGWTPRNQSKEASWRAEDGTLVKEGNGPDLVSTSKFKDFKLHIEFNCGVNANSGVFLRGRYEVQVETESAAEPNSHHTGGVYGFWTQSRSNRASPTFGRPSTSPCSGATLPWYRTV